MTAAARFKNKGMTFTDLRLRGFQMQNPLSGANGEVCEVSPAPPDISSYAEGPNETSQTSPGPDSAPLVTPTPPGLTTAQADIFNRLNANNNREVRS